MEAFSVGDWVRLADSRDKRLWRVESVILKDGELSPSGQENSLLTKPHEIICEVGIPGTKSYQREHFTADELTWVAKGSPIG